MVRQVVKDLADHGLGLLHQRDGRLTVMRRRRRQDCRQRNPEVTAGNMKCIAFPILIFSLAVTLAASVAAGRQIGQILFQRTLRLKFQTACPGLALRFGRHGCFFRLALATTFFLDLLGRCILAA